MLLLGRDFGRAGILSREASQLCIFRAGTLTGQVLTFISPLITWNLVARLFVLSIVFFFGSIENQGVMLGNFVDCRAPPGLRRSLATRSRQVRAGSRWGKCYSCWSTCPMQGGWGNAGSGIFLMELVQWVMVDRSSSCVYPIFSFVLILTIFVGLRFRQSHRPKFVEEAKDTDTDTNALTP